MHIFTRLPRRRVASPLKAGLAAVEAGSPRPLVGSEGPASTIDLFGASHCEPVGRGRCCEVDGTLGRVRPLEASFSRPAASGSSRRSLTAAWRSRWRPWFGPVGLCCRLARCAPRKAGLHAERQPRLYQIQCGRTIRIHHSAEAKGVQSLEGSVHIHTPAEAKGCKSLEGILPAHLLV